jgi:hypothetical protein
MTNQFPSIEDVDDRDVVERACGDCPAKVTTTLGKRLAGPVRILAIEHESSCPWFRRFGSGQPIETPHGVLIHHARGLDGGPGAA